MFLKSATYQTLTNFLHQYSGFVFEVMLICNMVNLKNNSYRYLYPFW